MKHRISRLLTAGLLSCLATSAVAGFAVSSYKKVSSSSTSSPYDAGAALDGNAATAWVINPEEENAGQWIEVGVPAAKIDKISVIVGWNRDTDTWSDHARVKEAKVELIDEEASNKVVWEKVVAFEDKTDRQIIDVPDVQVGGEYNGGKVRLTVISVYDGKDFAHLAMGEMLVHLLEFDVATVKLEGTPTSEQEEHLGFNLVDNDLKTFWASATDGEQTFRVSGGRYQPSSVGIAAGPATHARPKTIEIVQSETVRTYEVPDKPGVHWFDLPPLVGYTGSGVGPVDVRIKETYPGSASTAVGVSEVKLKATLIEAF